MKEWSLLNTVCAMFIGKSHSSKKIWFKRSFYPLFLSFSLFFYLTSHVSTAPVFIPKVVLKNISISADKDANGSRVTVVHLVVPKKEALYHDILKMDSSMYFETTDQLQADYPNDLEVFVWEVIPGSAIENQRIQLKDFRGQGAIVFLQYGESAGTHRLVLPAKSSVRILLQRNTGILAY